MRKPPSHPRALPGNFFPDDLRVAALEIKPCHKISSNRFGTLCSSLVRDDPFGRQHHGLWIEFRHARVHHFIHASLCEFLQLDLLCFRDLVFRQLWWYRFACIVRPPKCPTHVPLTVCFRQVESSELSFPEDDRHLSALIKPSVSDLSFDACSCRPRSP